MKTISRYIMTLALLITAATSAWADIAQDDVFMFGSYIDFGNGVWCKTFSGGTSNDAVVKSTKLPLTYGGYENGKHKLVFNSANATSYLYIYDANSAKPWGIKVTGGEGTSGNPFTFSTVYDWPNNCPQELIIGTDGTCSFAMPASDVNVNYELVRDMAVSMTTKVGDGNDGYRIRLKKNEQTGKYEPAEMTAQQMKELVKVHDAIENYDLTFGVLDANCIVNIYAANDENQAVGEPIAFADLTPGRYIAKAVAATGSAYEGETGMSNIFELYQGYEIKVAAGEYVTYYKDEALKVEDEDAKLYTITAVEDGKAVLSDASEVMPKNTPFLVHNNGTEEKTILLIPCNEPNLTVTVANEFKGTLEATTIEASTDAQANYVFNGKQFVWVKNAIEIGANKCWLSISNSNARTISLVFDETTKITTTNLTNITNGDWYDLNGRKLNGMPTKKGIYMNNGRKVVVK